MSNVGNLSSAQSSSVGMWCEATVNQNISISANSNATATFVAPAAGSGSYFTSNTFSLPIAVTLLTNTNYNSPSPNIQNAAGINVQLNNVSGATQNVNTNSRFLFVFNNGI